MRLTFFFAAFALSAPLHAQQPARGSDSASRAMAFERARRLVADGSASTGRALVDSLLANATVGTPAYAEALYWRASLAERGADAERDFRQLAVEYATTSRGADARLRLAQIDLVRGDPAGARDHLTRLLRDHTDAPTQARGQYWLARAALDASDAAASCQALNAAASAAAAGSDLARQVVALRGRVPRCTLHVAIGEKASAAAPLGTPAPTNPALPNTVVVNTPPTVEPPSAAKAEAKPEVVHPTARTAATSANGKAFTVQVAAFPTRAGADETAARLVRRGIEARAVAGGATPQSPPFRVRIGRWSTRAEANVALRDLKTKGLSGFVVEAEADR